MTNTLGFFIFFMDSGSGSSRPMTSLELYLSFFCGFALLVLISGIVVRQKPLIVGGIALTIASFGLNGYFSIRISGEIARELVAYRNTHVIRNFLQTAEAAGGFDRSKQTEEQFLKSMPVTVPGPTPASSSLVLDLTNFEKSSQYIRYVDGSLQPRLETDYLADPEMRAHFSSIIGNIEPPPLTQDTALGMSP